MRRTLAFLALFVFGMGISKAEDPILFGADIEGGGPYLYIGPDGKPMGFELDIIQAMESDWGNPFAICNTTFPTSFRACYAAIFPLL